MENDKLLNEISVASGGAHESSAAVAVRQIHVLVGLPGVYSIHATILNLRKP